MGKRGWWLVSYQRSSTSKKHKAELLSQVRIIFDIWRLVQVWLEAPHVIPFIMSQLFFPLFSPLLFPNTAQVSFLLNINKKQKNRTYSEHSMVRQSVLHVDYKYMTLQILVSNYSFLHTCEMTSVRSNVLAITYFLCWFPPVLQGVHSTTYYSTHIHAWADRHTSHTVSLRLPEDSTTSLVASTTNGNLIFNIAEYT